MFKLKYSKVHTLIEADLDLNYDFIKTKYQFEDVELGIKSFRKLWFNPK